MLALACPFLEGLKQLQEKNENISQDAVGELHILISKEILEFLNDFNKLFYASFPDIHIIWHESAVIDVLQQLSLEKMLAIINIGETEWNLYKHNTAYNRYPLLQGEINLLLSKKHPLAHKKRVSLKKITDSTIYILGDKDDNTLYDGLFRLCAVKPQNIKYERNRASLMEIVRRQIGISLISSLGQVPNDLTRVAIKEDTKYMVCFITPLDRELTSTEKLFSKELQRFFDK